MSSSGFSQDAVQKFLEEKIDPSMLTWVLETLQPFLERISRHEYPLVAASQVNEEKIRSVIQSAVESEVRLIEIVDPTWYRHKTVGQTTLDSKLYGRLYRQNLLNTVSDRYKKEIRSPLWDMFTRPLAYTIAKTVPHEYAFFAIPYSLEFFIGLAIEGKHEAARSLISLFQMCLQCIPFAERSDQKGTWIVYAATRIS